MFGLFRKKATPSEFGAAVLYLAGDSLQADAGRSLGMRFDEFDGSDGWVTFLEQKGVTMPTQKLYFRLFSHCAVQAAFTQFDEGMRKAITRGAISCFQNQLDNYDFETTYNTLEDVYDEVHDFDEEVNALRNPNVAFSFLPNPSAGVLNAKYLIETFAIPHMSNSRAFIDDFESYSLNVSVAVSTICRAIDHVARSFKIAR